MDSRWLLLGFAFLPAASAANDYVNVDSLQVGNLVYIGAIDRFHYGWRDSIRVHYVVANRGTRPDTIWAEGGCSGVEITEDWCSATGDSIHDICSAGETVHLGYCVFPIPPRVYPRPLAPGEHLIREMTVTVDDQDRTHEHYVIGHARFYAPWPPPLFSFEVRYARPNPTPIARWSWGQVKILFR